MVPKCRFRATCNKKKIAKYFYGDNKIRCFLRSIHEWARYLLSDMYERNGVYFIIKKGSYQCHTRQPYIKKTPAQFIRLLVFVGFLLGFCWLLFYTYRHILLLCMIWNKESIPLLYIQYNVHIQDDTQFHSKYIQIFIQFPPSAYSFGH